MADTPKKKLEPDPLVEALIPDPAKHQPATQLTGWLGKGAAPGTWRLYLTAALDEFVEFAEADVLHTQQLDKKDSPLGGSLVWVKAGATLHHTTIVTRNVQADFLSGDVTSGYMPGTSPNYPLAGARVLRRGNTRDYICSTNRHIPACQDRTPDSPCGGGGGGGSAFCPSGPFVCGPSAGCTNAQECSVGC
jgi:hypothetical protein